MVIVKNKYGIEIDFDAVVALMDDEIRESVHDKLAPCDEQIFFDEYAKQHKEKFGEEWEPAKENPCY